MRWIRFFSIVIGSVWFFPVSCTTGIVAGTHLISAFDVRDVGQGDTVHSLFSVVAEPGKGGKSFRIIRKDELARRQEKMESGEPVSFFMSKPVENIDMEDAAYSYRVLEKTGPEQLIEVIQTAHDGDYTVWSRYKAAESMVSPISSRMTYFGHMFQAIPYAFGFALILYITGRLFQRRKWTSGPGKEDS